MKRFGPIAVLLIVELLPVIAVGQASDSRSFDGGLNVRTKSLQPTMASGEKKHSAAAAKPQQSIGATCSVYGKALRTTNSHSCNVQTAVSVGPIARGIPISLCATKLTADSYTPHALGSPGGGSEDPALDVIFTPSGDVSTPFTLRQIKSPEGFIDIVPLNRWEYEIRFYHSGESVVSRSKLENSEGLKLLRGVSQPQPVSLYNVTGKPFAIWRFRNPNPPAMDTLQITRIKNGVAETIKFHYVGATDTWMMINNEDKVVSLKTSEINSDDPCERTEILVKRDHDVVIYKRTRVFRGFAWGQEIVKEIEEENGEVKTTSYTFYKDPAERNRYRQIESVINPDGSWEKYDYEQKDSFSPVIRRIVASSATETSRPQ